MKLKKNLFLFTTGAIIGLAMTSTWADTMKHYQNIVNSIPKMEMKADSKSQAWARSARNVMLLTGESIAESLVSANQVATQHGEPLFCIQKGDNISAEKMNELIQDTYRSLSGSQSDKENMSVSEVALKALIKKYPCQRRHAQGFGHSSYTPNPSSESSNDFSNPTMQQMVQADSN